MKRRENNYWKMLANSLPLSQIRELIKELKPVQQQSELKTRFDATYKQMKPSKELCEDLKLDICKLYILRNFVNISSVIIHKEAGYKMKV